MARKCLIFFSVFIFLFTDAKRMFEVSFALTLSLSKILYEEDERDPAMFGAMAAGLVRFRVD